MRLLIILGIVGAVLFLCFNHLKGSFERRTSGAPTQILDAAKVDTPQEADTILPALAPKAVTIPPPQSPTDRGKIESTVFFTHQFKHRLAPRIPTFLSDKKGVGIAFDEQTNTWIVEADEIQAEHLKKIVKMLDVAPEELDLDFVLLAVSEKWIRSMGVNLTFQEGANYLSFVGIYDTTGGLRFASGSLVIDITGEKANEHVSVYRTPVVRILEGEQWQLSETIETPIPVTQTIDGVTTTTVEYTSLGLKLIGKCSKGSKGWRLDLEQSNGSKGAEVKLEQYTIPERRTQHLKTAVYLEPDKWTVCGGVRNIEEITKKGILYKKMGFSKDLVLIFCRPRTSLRKVYKALPPFSKPDSVRDSDNILPHRIK